MTHRDNHGHDFMGKSDRCTICEGMKPVPDGEYLHPHTKETNEALKEFDEFLSYGWGAKRTKDRFGWSDGDRLDGASEGHTVGELKELFLSSIERARREEREKIEKERYEAFAEIVNESKQILKFVTIKVEQAVKKERQRVVEMIDECKVHQFFVMGGKSYDVIVKKDLLSKLNFPSDKETI